MAIGELEEQRTVTRRPQFLFSAREGSISFYPILYA